MAEKILAVRVALTGITDETRQISELNDEIQKLAQRRRELNKTIIDNGQATETETTELLANEQATRDLNEKKSQLTRTEKLAAKEFTVVAGSMNDLRAKTAKLRNEANNLNLTTDEGKRKFKEINQQIKSNTDRIRDYDRSISGSSTLVGEYGRGIMNAFSKIGIAVAAAWGIIKQGEKIIYSAQGASDQWEKTIGGLKNGLDELFKSLATGDFSGFLKGITDAIKAGEEYTEILDDLKDRLRQYAIAEVDAQKIILEKRKEMWDKEKKTKDERLAAAMEIDKIEDDLAKKKQVNMEIAFENERKTTAQHTRWTEDELMFYVKNYDQLTASLEIGEKYIKNQKAIESAMRSEIGVTQDLYDTQKTLAEQGGEYWARYVQNRNRANDEELDSLVKTYVAMVEAGNQYLQRTVGTKGVFRKIQELKEDIRKEEEKGIKDLSDAQKKAHDDYIKGLKDEHDTLLALIALEKARYDAMMLFQATETAKGMEGAGVLAEPGISEISEMPGENPRFTQAQIEAAMLLKIKEDAYALELEALKESLKRGEITEGEYLQRRTQAWQISFQGTTQDVIAGLGEMAGALEGFGKESKALTLFKIGLDTASAISSLVAMSEANPANAVTFGAAGMIQFATGVIRILANIMMARKIIMEGKGKYEGGTIRADDGIMLTKPTLHGDNMLIVAKKGEVVLNERQQSYFGKEAFRSAGVPGFAGGGMIGSAGINYAQGGGFDVNMFVNKLASILGDQKIYLQLNELSDANKKYAEIRTSSEL